MRNSFVLIALLAGTAYADPEIAGPSDVAPSRLFVRDSYAQPAGMWLDFGAGAANVAPGDGNVYKGSFVRFAPQATINRTFYLGAEINIGSFDSSTPASSSSAARGGGVDMPMSSGVDGTVGAVSALAGARAMAGIFSGAVELAGGVRYTTIRVSNSFNTETQGVVQARGRVDLWVTPHLSIGGIVGKDLNDAQSMMVGLNLGLHFERFDHSR